MTSRFAPVPVVVLPIDVGINTHIALGRGERFGARQSYLLSRSSSVRVKDSKPRQAQYLRVQMPPADEPTVSVSFNSRAVAVQRHYPSALDTPEQRQLVQVRTPAIPPDAAQLIADQPFGGPGTGVTTGGLGVSCRLAE